MQSPQRPAAVESAQAWLENHESELIELTRAMLRIPSVEGQPEQNAPFGSEVRKALDFALEIGKEWGMDTRDIEGYAGHCEFGHQKPMIMALGHLDVVPVGPGWKHEPFGAEIDEEYLYARGAVDDKGPTMAAFFAARALMHCGEQLPARIRVVFGCNEESGFKCVKRYFEVEEPPSYGVAPDSGWPLYHAEKGITNLVMDVPLPKGIVTILALQGGTRPNIVPEFANAKLQIQDEWKQQAIQKANEYWDKNVNFKHNDNVIEIDAIGKAAHGSTPFMGDNALVRVLRAIAEITPPEEQKTIHKLIAMGHPNGSGIGIHGSDEVSDDLTANLAIAETLPNGNVRFTINVRYPVTWNIETLKQKLESFVRQHNASIQLHEITDSPPLYFPAEREPIVTILEAYRAETNDPSPPGVMGGGTYARAVPNTVSIGTGWDGDGPAHENDERVKVSHLLKMAKIYAHILYRLAHLAAK